MTSALHCTLASLSASLPRDKAQEATAVTCTLKPWEKTDKKTGNRCESNSMGFLDRLML